MQPSGNTQFDALILTLRAAMQREQSVAVLRFTDKWLGLLMVVPSDREDSGGMHIM